MPRPINDSGIELDAEKELSRPQGIREAEEYRESFDTAGGQQSATRVFDVPWDKRQDFVEWALGYSYSVLSLPNGNPVPNPTPRPPGGGGYVADVGRFWNVVDDPEWLTADLFGTLKRVIPSQHPERPWLYAARCEFRQGIGVVNSRDDIWVNDDDGITWGNFTLEPNPDENLHAARAARTAAVAALDAWTTIPGGWRPDGNRTRQSYNSYLREQRPDLITADYGLVFSDAAQSLRFDEFLRAIQTGAFPPLQASIQPAVAAFDELARSGNEYAGAYIYGLQQLTQAVADATAILDREQQRATNALRNARIVPMIRYHYLDKPTQHAFARYAVTYQPLPYEVRPDWYVDRGELDRYVERRVVRSMKSFQISPAHKLKFSEGPFATRDVPSPGSALFPVEELTYIWHQVPDPNWGAINICDGGINNAPFDGALGYRSFATGTLLCQSPVVEREPRNIRGRVTHKITYKFSYNRKGWNKFPSADGLFYTATYGGGANDRKVYDAVNFWRLFKVPAPQAYQDPLLG